MLIAILYLNKLGATEITIEPGGGVDIAAKIKGKNIKYEVKATTDDNVAFHKLKVSSNICKELLEEGIEIMRICKIGQSTVDIYFLKYGEHFDLVPEPRYRVRRLI